MSDVINLKNKGNESRVIGRNDSISVAKAFAIILMVLAHARFSFYGERFINMFHMPLFFFFSGYCFKDVYLTNAKTFVLKKVKGIYWPAVKYGLLFLALHNVFYACNIYSDSYGFLGNVSRPYTWSDFFMAASRIVTRLTGQEELLAGYWFLHALFVGSLLFYLTLRIFKRPLIGFVLLLLSSVLFSFVLSSKGNSYFELLNMDLISATFIMLGYTYKGISIKLENSLWICFCAVLFLVLGTSFWLTSVPLIHHFWWKICPYVFSAFFGIIGVFAISNLIVKHCKILKNVLVYVGERTLAILTWHFLAFKPISLLIINVYGLPAKRLAEFPVIEDYAYAGWWILYVIFGVLFSIVMNAVLERLSSCVLSRLKNVLKNNVNV